MKKRSLITHAIAIASKRIKVKLDAKTYILLQNKTLLSNWLERYPNAQIIG